MTPRVHTRRDFLRLAGLAGLGASLTPGLLAACAAPGITTTPRPTGVSGTDLGTLRIGYLPITDAAPLLLAHARGLYAEQGLGADRPTLFRGWSQLAEAFQARQVDAVHILMPMAIWLRFSQGFPLRLVAWDHTGGSALTVADEVDRIEDLVGQTVAVPFWYSIHNVVLQLLFREAGITPLTDGEPSVDDRSVKLVVMAPPDMPPALSNGSIAGYIVADPFNAVAEVNGIGKVLRFTGDVWRDHACCVVVMHADDVRERPEYAQAVVSAIASAQLWAADNRTEAAALLSADGEGYLPQPVPAIERALTHYDHGEYVGSGAISHPEWETERIGFQPFPFPTYTEELVRLLKETTVEGETAFLDELDPASVHAELVEERFARQAIDELGGAAAFGLADGLSRTEQIEA
ncbi:MAG: ABC transporter substrate-binding protein [Chloroflexota bacterium]